jgi:hypothetical protein
MKPASLGGSALWWLGLAAGSLAACGDDSGPPAFEAGMRDGGFPEGGLEGGLGGGGAGTGGTGGREPRPPKSPMDGGPDAAMDVTEFVQPPLDAGCDINTGECVPPPPDAWTCPAAFWADGICDCGCTEPDIDCLASSCIEPGCVDDLCGACFTVEGSWKACTPTPSPDDWQCDPLRMADGLCDCGCGIPDPACEGSGCVDPGCRKGACDRRHRCAGVTDPADDDCSDVNPNILTSGKWKCAWDMYAAGDGCDCGCGGDDPECGIGGCAAGKCFHLACDACHDEEGRPFDCVAAEAGWTCNATRYDANDGCDCGCGAPDPDCGGGGCSPAGCAQAACDRCTDLAGEATGCAPATWIDGTHKCDTDTYGTGDGCDCGCGVDDPDCGAGEGCTAPGCKAAGCDACNDGAGFFVTCGGWTCGDESDPAFANAECDCGCGVVDPYCRIVGRQSCTADGCETPVCEYCNTGATRTMCDGDWESAAVGSPCDTEFYAIDGLCDCGCGAKDPDCPKGKGCTDKGCNASGCEVCHDGNLTVPCRTWTCDDGANGSGDGCDCGCGAPDPDCVTGGCIEPGCGQTACETCHDPAGRVVACP